MSETRNSKGSNHTTLTQLESRALPTELAGQECYDENIRHTYRLVEWTSDDRVVDNVKSAKSRDVCTKLVRRWENISTVDTDQR